MRTRIGNPSNEVHGQALRVYDWIAPAGTTPDEVVTKAETALGVKLRGVTGEAHGYVNTSTRADGSVYVAVHLYDTPCSDPACPTGHGAVVFAVAPDVSGKLAAMKASIGEHATHKLGNGRGDDVLRALGFTAADSPFR